MKYWTHTLLSIALITTTTAAIAITKDKVPSKKQTSLNLYLTASEASQMISTEKDILFLDIRTRSEVNFLGMPTPADANIPYFMPESWSEWNDKKGNFKLTPNSNFLTSVEERLQKKGLSKDSKIVLICRSGSRSAKAANLMSKAGYSNVYTIVDGYEGDKSKTAENKGQRVVNGWKNSGLPWSYKLDKEKMYFDF